MTAKIQWIALLTMIRYELVRMFRIPIQAFLPSVATNFLYFSIFGKIIGPRLGLIDGISYSAYITPGLLMLAVITNAYNNTSSSLFSMRFQHSIEEILISPIRPELILLGYTLGGIIRGVIVATLVLLLSLLFVPINWSNLPLTYVFVFLIACLFSLAGFSNAMVAKTFDDVMLIPTFVLSPLTYLGGIFYSIAMLPPIWQKLVQLNPIYYMVNLLRYSMLELPNQHYRLSIFVISTITLILIAINLILLKRGVGIRE